jgi:hypothetical protein
MIIGKEKLFQNGCRIRYCVAIILLQNKEFFLGDDGECSFESAIGVLFLFLDLKMNEKQTNGRRRIFFLMSIFFFFGINNFFQCIIIGIK